MNHGIGAMANCFGVAVSGAVDRAMAMILLVEEDDEWLAVFCFGLSPPLFKKSHDVWYKVVVVVVVVVVVSDTLLESFFVFPWESSASIGTYTSDRQVESDIRIPIPMPIHVNKPSEEQRERKARA